MKTTDLAKASHPTQAVKEGISLKIKLMVVGALATPVALLLAVVVFAAVLAGGAGSGAGAAAEIIPVACGVPAGDVPALDAEQDQNATTIVAVGKTRNVPQYGWIIAIATAMQESQLRNIPGGDRDSIGLFQQRPSQGWGTPEQIRSPVYAATAFYGGSDVPPDDKGLLDIPGWESMPLTVAAQSVQHSGFPSAYAKWEALARSTVTRLATGTDACPTLPVDLPNTKTGAMVRTALAQVGKPYVFGGSGPDVFDCSGLIWWSWRQVGITLSIRSARDMYAVASPLQPQQAQTGDMIFTAFGTRGLAPDEPGHIQLIVTPAKIVNGKVTAPGQIVEAPEDGVPVRVRPYNPFGSDLRFGRFPASALHPTR